MWLASACKWLKCCLVDARLVRERVEGREREGVYAGRKRAKLVRYTWALVRAQ